MKKSVKRRRQTKAVVMAAAFATAGVSGIEAAPLSQARQSGAPGAAGAAQDAKVLQFKIPAGPLDGAIAEFERVTGLKVVLGDPRIGSLQSPGVIGAFTAVRAMDALTAGIGVRATFTGGTVGSVKLDLKAVTTTVSVEAEPKMASPKYTAPIRDTAQTLVVIPHDLLQEQNATSLRDVLRNTPGITMSIGEGGSGGTSSGDNVLIRGFSARTDIYIDGVRDPGMVNRDAYNVESVEVAKGPSSASGGRGTTGGSINMVTKTANLDEAGTVQVTGGNADYARTSFDVNHKLTDSMAFRLNGMWQDTGYAGRDVAKYRSWAMAPALSLGLDTPTQLTLTYSRMKQNNIPDWGLPTLLPDVAINAGLTVNNLNFSNFYGLASRDYEHTTSDLGTATIKHRFGPHLSVRNVSRAGRNYRDAVITPPRPAAAVAGQGPEDPDYNAAVAQIRRTDTKYQHRDDQIIANQTDVTAFLKLGSVQQDMDFGVDLARDHQPTYAFTDLFTNGRPPVDDLFNPSPFAAYTPAFAKTGASSDAHAITAAVYAFDTVKLTPHWELDLGGRFDHVKADYTSVATTGVATPFGRTDRAWSGRNGIVYKPVQRGSIYAAYSTSFTPSFDGTLGLTLAATGVNSQLLAPERTHNLEAGTKWDVMRGLHFSAAVFKMEKTNARTTDATGATVLAGDQRVKGVEFGLDGTLTSRWSVFAGLSVMHGTVVASDVTVEQDQELAYVPHVTFNVWTSYKLTPKLSVGGSVDYSDGNFFNQTGTFLYVSGGTVPQAKYVANAAAVQALTKYTVANAMARYQVSRHILLQINGTNLFDEKYADRAYDRHFLPGQTRQVLLSPVITW